MRTRKSGFTLIELLVVISIIALLVSILLPALSKAREQAKKAVCASQLHTIGISLIMYTGEYNGFFPPSYGGFWMNELSNFTSNYIIENGGERHTFYCPSNKGRDPVYGGDYDPDHPWDWQHSMYYWFGVGQDTGRIVEETPENLASYGIPIAPYEPRTHWRRTTYFWLMKEAPGTIPAGDPYYGVYTRGNEHLDGTWESIRPHVLIRGVDDTAPYRELVYKAAVESAADVELVVDMTITFGWDLENDRFDYPWPEPAGPVLDSTSHRNRDGKGQGGHNLFVDGHVDWESIDEVHARFRVHGWRFPIHWW